MPTTVRLALVSRSALADVSLPQLILADKFDPYKLVYEDCLVFNPGSFARRRFGWSTYYPQMVDPKERMEERWVLCACR